MRHTPFKQLAMPSPKPSRLMGVFVALLAYGQLGAHAGPSIDQFDVKDFESTPGAYAFQSRNAHMFSQPHRAHANDGGEMRYDDNSMTKQRHSMKIDFGITLRLRHDSAATQSPRRHRVREGTR